MKASRLLQLNTFIDVYTCTLPCTYNSILLSSALRYKKCERIEKAKTERVVKPLKSMSLNQMMLLLFYPSVNIFCWFKQICCNWFNWVNRNKMYNICKYLICLQNESQGSFLSVHAAGGSAEGSPSMELGVRKQSLRNITPRSYSSLLKSESEEEEEQEVKADKSTVKPNVAAASKQGN